VELPRPPWFDPAFAALLARTDLPSGLADDAFRDLLHGRVDDVLAAAFVTALRMKGESPAEIAAAARGLREQMIRLVPVSGPVTPMSIGSLDCAVARTGANSVPAIAPRRT